MVNLIRIHYIPIVKFIATLSLIAIGLIAITLSVLRNPTKHLVDPDFRVEISSHTINFFTNDQSIPIFHISPLDDYSYQGPSRNHLIESSLMHETNPFYEVRMLLDNFYSNGKLIWAVKGEHNKTQAKIRYEITNKGSGWLEIKRFITAGEKTISALGQAVVFCKDCMVKDDLNRVFFQSVLLTKQKLDLAKHLGLTSYVIGYQLPQDTKKLLVIDQNGKTLLDVLKTENQEVFYEENWHLLEFRAFVFNNWAVQLVRI